jgi:ubiquinone/menaquinone biosynthesis C-methylase UbiE
VSDSLGRWVSRIPDGETGPRSDWIVWQYPVLSSRPEFEVCPPDTSHYRALPRLRVRDGEQADHITFEDLGYAQAATSSYRTFASLKRDGVIPNHCRFQVSLPTPLAPISAFVTPDDQERVEPIYEGRLLDELARILAVIPHDQLAIQWDTNVEFAMLEGAVPVWFANVRAGIVERLLRLSRQIPTEVELGYHLCYGDEGHRHTPAPPDARKLVEVGNSLSASLDRPLNWLHLPVPLTRTEPQYFEPLADLALRPETEVYLGLLHLADGVDGALTRIEMARPYLEHFGVATECGWGRQPSRVVLGLVQLQTVVATPIAPTRPTAQFAWPAGVVRIPDEDWTRQPVDEFGLAYDSVNEHGWYQNLDPTVEELAQRLREGDILLDYSGGTGILVDRLKLRIFDRPVGMVIADSSPRFLRVAVEKFATDERVAVRLLRYRRDDRRLQRIDEVVGPELLERGFDAIASTNAIHLYPDLDDTLAALGRVLRPGGHLLINSGNIRNPRAKQNEWILDETVWVINDLAEGIVRTDPRYGAHRAVLDDTEQLKQHSAFRDRVFLEPRPLDFYLDALSHAGFTVDEVREQSIRAAVDDWYQFLTAYHDAVLGWVGGNEKVNGRPPSPDAVADRLALIRQAMDTLFNGRPEFFACWTYITARR